MFLRLRVGFLVTLCALVSHATLSQGRSPPGCVARMFRVAGVPGKTSSSYELALRNGIKTMSKTHQDGISAHTRVVTNAMNQQTKANAIGPGPKQKTCARLSSRDAFPSSRVYIADWASFTFKAYCNMHVQGGGWTVIQRRKDGSVNFQRRWKDYKVGFGSLTGEFWLGLDKIHAMTSSGSYELLIVMLIVMRNAAGKRGRAYYSSFRVAGEKNKYRLQVSRFRGEGVTPEWPTTTGCISVPWTGTMTGGAKTVLPKERAVVGATISVPVQH